MTEKPLVLSTDMTLVDHDLSSVFAHYLEPNSEDLTSTEVKFKKKEDIGILAKSVLKHRIQSLTGKNIQALEAELGKSIEKVEDLRRLAKFLLLEVFEKLPKKAKIASNGNARKRAMMQDDEDSEVTLQEPARKRGRKSLAVSSPRPALPTPSGRGRRSMLPSIPIQQVSY